MSLVIGPILKQGNGYAFDTWKDGEGEHRSYAYSRIEDAYHALKWTAAEAASDRHAAPIVCTTSDEFALQVGHHSGARRPCLADR